MGAQDAASHVPPDDITLKPGIQRQRPAIPASEPWFHADFLEHVLRNGIISEYYSEEVSLANSVII